ncbi:translation initiation factor IF-2-like [Monodelphis domestica]|uniref:translation initiation factor IF-2-like n=1 Tax=Monodelphis domestica TaxID=13616 RepID=UPI0024E20323|nr:translation initiation factor IF-2-like [Monodelphis domestica]
MSVSSCGRLKGRHRLSGAHSLLPWPVLSFGVPGPQRVPEASPRPTWRTRPCPSPPPAGAPGALAPPPPFWGRTPAQHPERLHRRPPFCLGMRGTESGPSSRPDAVRVGLAITGAGPAYSGQPEPVADDLPKRRGPERGKEQADKGAPAFPPEGQIRRSGGLRKSLAYSRAAPQRPPRRVALGQSSPLWAYEQRRPSRGRPLDTPEVSALVRVSGGLPGSGRARAPPRALSRPARPALNVEGLDEVADKQAGPRRDFREAPPARGEPHVGPGDGAERGSALAAEDAFRALRSKGSLDPARPPEAGGPEERSAVPQAPEAKAGAGGEQGRLGGREQERASREPQPGAPSQRGGLGQAALCRALPLLDLLSESLF